MMFKIATSVKKLHQEHICHFDLKDENIFTMNDYTPVLGDLSLMMSEKKASKDKFWGGT